MYKNAPAMGQGRFLVIDRNGNPRNQPARAHSPARAQILADTHRKQWRKTEHQARRPQQILDDTEGKAHQHTREHPLTRLPNATDRR